MQKAISKMDKLSAGRIIFFAVAAMVVISLLNEKLYIIIGGFFLPIAIGIVVLYRLIRESFILKNINYFDLLMIPIIHYIYCFNFYLYQQGQFDEYCRLNNEPLDLDGLYIFFTIFIVSAFLFILIAVLISLVYLGARLVKKRA